MFDGSSNSITEIYSETNLFGFLRRKPTQLKIRLKTCCNNARDF